MSEAPEDERSRKDSSLELSEGVWPADTLT